MRGHSMVKGKIGSRLYKRGRQGLNWKQVHSREAATVVKGTNRRVIVVKSPDPRIFDEAIFVIKEEYMKRGGSMEQMLEEARQAAGEYLRKNTAPRKFSLPGKRRNTLLAAAGAVMAGLAWAAMRFVGI